MNRQYLTKTELAKRWSQSLIDLYFPKPTLEKTNPHHKRGSPMLLYDIGKVIRIESTQSFKEDLEKVYKHKLAAKERARKKREELIMHANGVQINIPDYEKNKLIELACAHYNKWNKNAYYPASPSSDHIFLKRITINYLRHQCTCYDDELGKFYRKVGVQEAHNVLQTRINEAIKQKYEWLRGASTVNISGSI